MADVIESRLPARGGDADTSYVARLLKKGPDGFLKKIGEEATEVVMAAKDADVGGDKSKVVGEVADLWFHCMVALAHYGLRPADVIAELERCVALAPVFLPAVQNLAALDVADGKAEVVPVSVGYTTDTEAVITKGIAPGDTVVFDGQSRLKDGATVKIVEGTGGNAVAEETR